MDKHGGGIHQKATLGLGSAACPAMCLPMPHPIHVHGRQFQVIERNMHPNFAQQWASITAGYLDYGWKDTILLLPGETVRIAVQFDGYPGVFVYHCHNLEHEDLGMMRNYEVRA